MLSVKGLHFTYPGADTEAVSGVSFDVEHGEIFGFLGPSGAGKSTVQRILHRQLQASAGEVIYDGKPLSQWGGELFEQIGVSFELPNLYPRLSGRQNLEAVGRLYAASCRPAKELFAAVGMSEALDRKAADYSKGMKQRLVFVRAIQHRPRMLFLDEPTGGNDPATTEAIIELIRAEKERGATVLLTTHDMHVADALCDRIAFINEGKIVACDTPRQLKLDHGRSGIAVEHRQGDELVEITIDPSSAADRTTLDGLLASGAVETLHSREASLGEIFIQLTGRALQ